MSELKPCFCEPCAACFGNGHAFNDLIGRSTRCSICAGTGRVSRAAQITPQAGEGWTDEAIIALLKEDAAWETFGLMQSIPEHIQVAVFKEASLRWARKLLTYRTAPPPPVCPHIRSSKDGTSWCDLAASVGDLSPGAGEAEPFGFYSEETDTFFLHEYTPVMPANTLLLYRTPQPPVAPVWQPVMRELVEAMHRYEMDVDDEPPYEHRQMMDRAHKLLSALPPDSPGATEEA